VRDEELAKRLVIKRGVGGRCAYDESAKQELIEKCLVGDVSIAQMARAYGVNANQLHNWIGLHGKRAQPYLPSAKLAAPPDRSSAFIPVMTPSSPDVLSDIKLDITFSNATQVELKGLRQEDVLKIIPLLAGLPCSASIRD